LTEEKEGEGKKWRRRKGEKRRRKRRREWEEVAEDLRVSDERCVVGEAGEERTLRHET
jgi:hypothetical protein